MLRTLAGGMFVVLGIMVACGPARGVDAGNQDAAAQVRAGLKQLNESNDRTVKSRLGLAHAAIDAGTAASTKDPKASEDAFTAAREVLLDAAKIEPGNKEVADLLQTVQRRLPKPAPAPAATNPAAVPSNTKPAPDAKAEPLPVKRMVSAGELNRIRQIEWHADEIPAPSLRVDPDTRKKFLAASPDVVLKDFNALSQDAQARQILDSGKGEFYSGIHITRDPASIREFKTDVQKVLESTCAGCHNSRKPGHFSLFGEKNDAAVYSNFLIIQKYSAKVNGVERLMVDRTTPESSLLLQFMLPANLTDAPHPQVAGFKPPVNSKNDARYQLALKWLKSLDPLAPHYGIDLTADELPPASAPIPVPKK